MYTERDRQQLRDTLRRVAERAEGIQGMVLVGSGASGFRDRYSDLDVVVVESACVPAVHESLIFAIEADRPVLKHKVYRHESDIFVSCLLFAGHLELDLGVWPAEKLRATKAHWGGCSIRRAPTIDGQLKRILRGSASNFEETARESTTYMWQFIRGALAATARGNPIQAFKQMEYWRDKVSELAVQRQGIHHDVAKELARVPSDVVERLRATYEGTMDVPGSPVRMKALVELYCDLIAEIRDATPCRPSDPCSSTRFKI